MKTFIMILTYVTGFFILEKVCAFLWQREPVTVTEVKEETNK